MRCLHVYLYITSVINFKNKTNIDLFPRDEFAQDV